MPVFTIEVPEGARPTAKARMLREITEALDEAYHFPDTRGWVREYPAENVAHGALKDTQDLEKKLIASLKRGNETLLSQVSRARAAVAPLGEAQERALTLASFLIRYGPELLDGLDAEVARWAGAS